jgi:hypothetical protein
MRDGSMQMQQQPRKRSRREHKDVARAAPLTKAQTVLRNADLLRMILAFVSYHVEHLRTARVRIDSHFHRACLAPTPSNMRILDLRGIQGVNIPKTFATRMLAAEALVRQVHISHCNVTALVRVVHKQPFANLERITMAHCDITRGSKRGSAATQTYTAEWLQHPRPQLQVVDLTGSKFLTSAGIMHRDNEPIIRPSGKYEMMFPCVGGQWFFQRIEPCSGGCQRPCLSPERIAEHKMHQHECSPNSKFPCVCKQPRAVEQCVYCDAVCCETCTTTRTPTQRSFRLCRIREHEPTFLTGNVVCASCCSGRVEENIMAEFETAECDSCETRACEFCHSDCERCGGTFCSNCKPLDARFCGCWKCPECQLSDCGCK